MAQKKGQTGNPNGRPKGVPNKATADLRKWINDFIQGQTYQIEKDWKKLQARDRIILFEKLLKYAVPALQSMSASVDFEKLTDEDLDRIITELKK